MSGHTLAFHRFEAFDAASLYAVLKLRFDVFIVEQNCVYPELDDQDQQALHCVMSEAGVPIATLRILFGDPVKIGRVAVAKPHRGKGHAGAMMRAALAEIESRAPGVAVYLSAQKHLEAFYGAHGFTRSSGVYDDGGIPHIDMTRA